jgi:hypothetical protein
MTSRRLVLLPAALLVTAISLAFWLNGWVGATSYAAGTPPFAKTALGGSADSIPTVRTPGFGGAIDQRAVTVRAGRTTVSLAAQGGAAEPWTPFAHGVSRSTSSRSEQITLSVGRVEEARTLLPGPGIRTWLGRLEPTSLNPTSSLDEVVA